MSVHILEKRSHTVHRHTEPDAFYSGILEGMPGGAPAPTVLVVDDDADMMRIMMHTLGAAGYRAIPARGGIDALRQVKTVRPDLIVIDLAMPQMSSVEVISRLKRDAVSAHIPVLAVTISERGELAISAGQAGCDGYVSKPIQRKTLLRAVEHLISQNRPPSGPDRPDTTPDLCA